MNKIGLQNINNAIHVIYNQIGIALNSAVAIILIVFSSVFSATALASNQATNWVWISFNGIWIFTKYCYELIVRMLIWMYNVFIQIELVIDSNLILHLVPIAYSYIYIYIFRTYCKNEQLSILI